MVYRITIKGGEPWSVKYRRADAAHNAAIRMTYEQVKSLAGLDTKWGHAAIEAAEKLDPYVGGEFPIGSQHRLYFTRSHS